MAHGSYTCPVCGFDELDEPATNWTICPCCGTEFEYDDARTSHEELRQRWIAGGCKWWSPVDAVPPGWDPRAQLDRLAAATKR